MKVQQITIENVGSLDELTLTPGALTVLEGRNGVGKSSVLTAIDAVISGGHDPSIIRAGADKAVVTITLDDGTQIRRSVTPKTSSLTITTKDGDKKAAPASYLAKVIDTAGWNPAKFLEAKPAERVSMLLSALPIEVDRAELAEKIPVWVEKHWTDGAHPLEGLAAVRKAIYDERTFANRRVSELQVHFKDLVQTLPPEGESDPREDLSAAVAVVSSIDEDLQAKRKLVYEDLQHGCADLVMRRSATVKEIVDKREEEIASLHRQIHEVKDAAEKRLREIDADYEKTKDTLHETARTADLEVDKSFEPRQAEAREALGKARERVKQQGAYDETHKKATEIGAELDRQRNAAERLTGMIAVVDYHRQTATANLPIPGVSIADGEVYLAEPGVAGGDRIPWPRINRSRQVRIAVEVARIRAGDLGLIVLDEAECMDPETWKDFVDAARMTGSQLIAARVTDDDELKVSNAADVVEAGGAA